MKDQKEMRADLDRAYVAACEQAGCKSWGDFAKLCGIPEPSVYRMIAEGGKISTQMLRRVYIECALKGIKIEGSDIMVNGNNAQNVNAPVTQTTTTDERWFALVAEKDVQISRLLGIIEKMQD